MQNPLSSKVKQIDGKIYVELPVQVTDKPNIKSGDIIKFCLSKHVEIWKGKQITIPEEIVPLLRVTFKSEDYIFRWLNAPQKMLRGQNPVSLLSSDQGVDEVKSLLKRISQGGFRSYLSYHILHLLWLVSRLSTTATTVHYLRLSSLFKLQTLTSILHFSSFCLNRALIGFL